MKLTEAERQYLLWLIEVNEREGVYYGNQKHFLKRRDKVKQKLNEGNLSLDNICGCGKSRVEHRCKNCNGKIKYS